MQIVGQKNSCEMPLSLFPLFRFDKLTRAPCRLQGMRKLGKHVNDGCDKAGTSLWRGFLKLHQAKPGTISAVCRFMLLIRAQQGNSEVAHAVGKGTGPRILQDQLQRKRYLEYTLNGSNSSCQFCTGSWILKPGFF